jgi:hypothetical protein
LYYLFVPSKDFKIRFLIGVYVRCKLNKRESALRASVLGCAKYKELSIERYYKNPNYCFNCGSVIKINIGEKPSSTKKKKFCNSSCAATYNNAKKRKKNITQEEKIRRKERAREYSKEYRTKNKEKTLVRAKKYRDENKEKNHIYRKEHDLEIRIKFIEMYGGKCECCGETQVDFLTLDHIDYSSKGKWETGRKGYVKALDKYRPDLYQVLCYNCNCARRHGICPHKK